MIDREQFVQEMQLRQHIREAIKVIKHRRGARLQEERQLRAVVRQLITEADPAVSTDAVHANTGINALEDLFKNTNLLSVLRQGYKSLTSKEEQRQSYKNHILNAVDSSLEVEDARFDAPDEAALEEVVDIDVGARPEDDPAFIDVEKREPTEEDEVEGFTLAGQDRTGRNRAYTDYKDVEKNVITAFDDLDDPSDRAMFKDYLLTNLKLYFERFEEELQTDLPAPDIQTPADAQVAPGPEVPPPGPPVQLQEKVNLDMDEIVEWLLSNDMKK
tara:strand:+ start:135 stop:953 length:819 start_codon:yes stop_codon:yes gene_type:complete